MRRGRFVKWADDAGRIESLWSLGNLIWTAVAAIGGGSAMTWVSSFSEFVSKQGIFGYACVFLISSFAIALCIYLVQRAKHIAEEPMAAQEGNNRTSEVAISQSVVSINQSGGVTARTYVNEAPKPEIRTLGEARVVNSDGSCTVTIRILIISPYPPSTLEIFARANTIVDLEIVPDRTGIHMFGHSGKRDGFCFTSINHPAGGYELIVRTRISEPVKIEYQFT